MWWPGSMGSKGPLTGVHRVPHGQPLGSKGAGWRVPVHSPEPCATAPQQVCLLVSQAVSSSIFSFVHLLDPCFPRFPVATLWSLPLLFLLSLHLTSTQTTG